MILTLASEYPSRQHTHGDLLNWIEAGQGEEALGALLFFAPSQAFPERWSPLRQGIERTFPLSGPGEIVVQGARWSSGVSVVAEDLLRRYAISRDRWLVSRVPQGWRGAWTKWWPRAI